MSSSAPQPTYEEVLFNASAGRKLTISQVAAAARTFMEAQPERAYKITIGTDSMIYDMRHADFVTAIVVHRVGNGGIYFWRRVDVDRYYTLRDRMFQEVLISLQVAQELLLVLQTLALPRFDFEIHVDIGENGETRSMIQEVTGMVRAYNFAVKTKPESYAASKVADRHT